MSKFTAAIDRAKGIARQTGKGVAAYGRDAYNSVTEPVPVRQQKPKPVRSGKLPRWQKVAQELGDIAQHNLAEGTGRKRNRNDRRDFDFGVAGADNFGSMSGSDPWGLGFGGRPKNPAIRRHHQKRSGGKTITIKIER